MNILRAEYTNKINNVRRKYPSTSWKTENQLRTYMTNKFGNNEKKLRSKYESEFSNAHKKLKNELDTRNRMIKNLKNELAIKIKNTDLCDNIINISKRYNNKNERGIQLTKLMHKEFKNDKNYSKLTVTKGRKQLLRKIHPDKTPGSSKCAEATQIVLNTLKGVVPNVRVIQFAKV